MWPLIIAAASAGMSIAGQQSAKKAAKKDAEFTAAQQREAAMRSRATGQRQAAEERRQARLLDSALQARAGGGGLDPTVQKISMDIAGEGEYRALAALYDGEMGALGNEAQADAAIRSAKAYGKAMNYATASTVISAGSTMYSKYADSAGQYNYANDASGTKFSATSAAVRGRR